MRKLNNEEQEIVQGIVQARKDIKIQCFCIATIFDETLDSVAIEWTDDKVIIYTEKDINAQEQFMRLCDLISLFKYLETEGMILLYRNPNLITEKALYNRNRFIKKGHLYFSKLNEEIVLKGKPYILYGMNKQHTFEVYADSITYLMDKYVCALVHPTQELVDYVNNGFMTKEDLHNKKMIRLTHNGIWAAIIIGLITTIIGVIGILINICKC